MTAPRPYPGRHLPHSFTQKLHSSGHWKLQTEEYTRDFKFPFHSLTQLSPPFRLERQMTWRSIGYRYYQCADGAHKVLLAALLELDLGCFKADPRHLIKLWSLNDILWVIATRLTKSAFYPE